MACKLSVLDVHFRWPYLGPGASYVRWELEKAGIELVEPAQADWVLASVQCEWDWELLGRSVRRYGIGAPIVIGGSGAMAPLAYGNMVVGACTGEGRGFLQRLIRDGPEAALELGNVWRPGATEQVKPDRNFPWDFPPARHQDGTTRLWFSRGCRNRCLFCKTGWEMPYRRTPNPEEAYGLGLRLWARGDRVVFTTNDGTELEAGKCPPQPHYSGTLAGLMKLLEKPGRPVGTIRIGIEGISERLRGAVMKPLSATEILTATAKAIDRGILVRWYFIVGLPGETVDDWDELKRLFMGMKRNVSAGMVAASFHAFLPESPAPMGLLPITDDYWERYQAFRKWFVYGEGISDHIQHTGPKKPETRLRHAQATMACGEERLYEGWAEVDPPNWIVDYVSTKRGRRVLAEQYARRVGLRWPT